MLKVLTFYLGKEKYGVEIDHIVTVEKNERPITNIPNGSDVLRGVVNIRSKIVPIIDLKKLLTGNAEEVNRQDCKLIIFDKNQFTGAIQVDDTDNIIDVSEDQVEKIERKGKMHHIVNLGEEAFVILDLDQIIEKCRL